MILKYRAYDVQKKEWIDDRLLSLSPNGTLYVNDEEGHGDWIEAPPDVVKLSFSTGLHDKNGKEIWEGDICKVGLGQDFTVVEYFNGSFVFQPKHLRFMFVIDKSNISEVLGNIYENSDLLK